VRNYFIGKQLLIILSIFDKEKKMNSNKNTYKFFNSTDQKKVNRRTFFTQSVGYTAGLTLLAFPGIITEAFAAKEGKSNEEIFKELEAKVETSIYGACSQRSFAALNEQFELKADQIIPALLPFAGGVAGKGETCGAVTGSLFAIGIYFESIIGKRGSSMKCAKLFFDRFSNEFGSTRCREVIKHHFGRYYDLEKPEDQRLFMEASKINGGCVKVIQKAVVMAGDIILENS
jgi:C_GCAxxG_C_C family probable redox protein